MAGAILVFSGTSDDSGRKVETGFRQALPISMAGLPRCVDAMYLFVSHPCLGAGRVFIARTTSRIRLARHRGESGHQYIVRARSSSRSGSPGDCWRTHRKRSGRASLEWHKFGGHSGQCGRPGGKGQNTVRAIDRSRSAHHRKSRGHRLAGHLR